MFQGRFKFQLFISFTGSTQILLSAILCFILFTDGYAQVGDCTLGTAEAYLDVGDVRAKMYNTGGLFYREGTTSNYEVPKSSGNHSVFALSNVFIGEVNGQLRGSAARYSNWEFWPGPLDGQGQAPADCNEFDMIWEITRTDIEQYESTGFETQNIRSWPWELGAPVIDGDGKPGNYNLAGGDRPELLGDQRLWWIINDKGNVHQETGSDPLGIELRASAFAFEEYFPRTTFYRYEYTYRGDGEVTNIHTGFFADGDLGNGGDDFIGTDTLLNMGYFYNSANEDEDYGRAPPAVGFMFINTPEAAIDKRDNDNDMLIDEPGEQLGITGLGCASIWGFSDCDLCEINDWLRHHYNCNRGLSGYGYILGEGQTFYEPESTEFLDDYPPTRFYYPGDPVKATFWSLMKPTPQGPAASGSDRSFSMGTGPFTLQKDESIVIDFAIIWAKGENNLDSVTKLRADATFITKLADDIYRPVGQESSVGTDSEVVTTSFAVTNYPNPFSASTALQFTLPETMHVRLVIFDMLGREVEVLVDRQQAQGSYTVHFDGSMLPSGIYYAKFNTGNQQHIRKMMLVR